MKTVTYSCDLCIRNLDPAIHLSMVSIMGKSVRGEEIQIDCASPDCARMHLCRECLRGLAKLDTQLPTPTKKE